MPLYETVERWKCGNRHKINMLCVETAVETVEKLLANLPRHTHLPQCLPHSDLLWFGLSLSQDPPTTSGWRAMGQAWLLFGFDKLGFQIILNQIILVL